MLFTFFSNIFDMLDLENIESGKKKEERGKRKEERRKKKEEKK